jgi:hypothetical protein
MPSVERSSTFHVPCIDVFYVENGKVSAFDCHYAGTIMLAQLGVLGNLEASLKKQRLPLPARPGLHAQVVSCTADRKGKTTAPQPA